MSPKLAHALPDVPETNNAARVRAAAAGRREIHRKLVEVLRAVVRPGGTTRWSELRRVLSLAGLRRNRVVDYAIVLALIEVAPAAYLTRGQQGTSRPRQVNGIRLVFALDKVRSILAAEWEQRLGMRRVADIPLEYKLGPEAAQNRRIGQLVAEVQARRRIHGGYFAKAVDYLHSNGWSRFPGHKDVWRLHCEGATKDEIAAELRRSGSDVQRILAKHRARAGLRS